MITVTGLLVLAVSSAQVTAAIPEGIPTTTLGLPDPDRRIVISDLAVRLNVPEDQFEHIAPLGLDSAGAIVAWATYSRQSAAILRFEPRTGSVLSRSNVSLPDARPTGGPYPVLSRESNEVLLLEMQFLHAISMDGFVVKTTELPFAPSAILVAQGDTVFLGGRRPGFSSPVHVLVRSSGFLESGQAVTRESADAPNTTLRDAVRTYTGDLWIVDERTYRLERWDPKDFALREVLSAHPMLIRYLMGPYSDYRMTGLHLVDGRYLWVFMTLKHRSAPAESFVDRNARFIAEYDGLAEVIDLTGPNIIASGYFPELELSGWIAGPVGFRSNPDGTIDLIYCEVESQS